MPELHKHDLYDLAHGQLDDLKARLIEEGIPHSWTGSSLNFSADDQAKVDGIIDTIRLLARSDDRGSVASESDSSEESPESAHGSDINDPGRLPHPKPQNRRADGRISNRAAFVAAGVVALVLATVVGVIIAVQPSQEDSSLSQPTADATTTSTTESASDPTSTEPSTGETAEEQRAAIEDFMSNVQSDTGVADTGEAYTYTSIADDTGQLTVDVPQEWEDVDGRIATLGNLELPDLRASTDLASYNSSYDVPGFQFQATDQTTTGDPRAVLGEYAARSSQDCAEDLGVQPYSDPLYTGVSQVFSNCGGSGAAFVWTVVQPIDTSDGDYIAVVGVQILSDADIEALGHILDTFVVTPSGA